MEEGTERGPRLVVHRLGDGRFERGIVAHRVLESLCQVRGARIDLDRFLDDGFLSLVGLPGTFLGHSLTAPDTEVAVARSLSVTTRTRERREVLGLVLDFETVDTCEFAVSLLVEDRDVPRRDARTPYPPHTVFEVCLTHALRREIRGARLAEVGERDGLRDVGTPSKTFEDVVEVPVRHRGRLLELTPKRGVGVATPRVVVEPLPQMRDRGDERDTPLSRLPVDGYLETVLVFGDVSELDIAELSGACTGVPRDRDHRGVSEVRGGFAHTFALIVRDHVAGVGLRVMVSRRRTADPVGVTRNLVTVGEVSCELSNGDAVVSVRLLGFETSVYREDSLFTRVAVLGDVLDRHVVTFGEKGDVPEELRVSVVAVLARTEPEFVAEREEYIALFVGEVVGFTNSFTEVFDAVHRTKQHMYPQDMNVWSLAGGGI